MDDYGNYKPQKPLSSRLTVETGTKAPDNTKRSPTATAKPQGLPAYMKPVTTSGKQQGISEGSAGEVNDYLTSVGDTQGVSGWEAHAAQMYLNGNEEALDCF